MNRERIIFISAGILIILAVVVTFVLTRMKYEREPSDNQENNLLQTTTTEPDKNLPTNVAENSSMLVATSTDFTYVTSTDKDGYGYSFTLAPGETNLTKNLKFVQLPTDLFKNLSWHLPLKLNSSDYDVMVTKIDATESGDLMGGPTIFDDPTTYEIGTFNYENKSGKILFINNDFFVQFDNQMVFLKQANIPLTDFDAFDKNSFLVDNNLKLPNIPYPQKITLSKYNNLELIEPTIGDFDFNICDNSLDKNCHEISIDNQPNIGKIFYKAPLEDPSLYIILPNGQLVYYKMKINEARIISNANSLGKGKFQFMASGWCGQEHKGLQCIDGITPYDLTLVKNDGLNSIYDIKNTNNEWYTNFVNGHTTYGSDGTITSASSTKQLFFWVDQFGRVFKLQNTEVQSMTECGKPVIYLYPKTETKVNVQIKPNGGLTKVDPFYPADGWLVKAKPNGELTNLSDKQQYPYLFWEGNAYNMDIPSDGFVLKKENIKRDMTKLLTRLGLNEKETTDFLEFWQSKLEEKPYVFVTFVSQTNFDKVAPLNISPRPDKVIRVFMDYQPLDLPVAVRPLKIETPVRAGFTVVEWGGRLHQ